jgi:hypothetical protein
MTSKSDQLENYKIINFESNSTEVNFEGANGIRITGENIMNTQIELKIGKEWIRAPYIQEITINWNIINRLPQVTIKQLIIPKKQ